MEAVPLPTTSAKLNYYESMMRIYFVRHGESVENAKQIFDDINSPLTELGVMQARFLAKRFKNIKLDMIFTSDMKRAVQTGEEINKFHKVKLVKSELLREKKVPSELLKLSETDSMAIKVMSEIRKNIHDENFRYKDQETFGDFKNRVLKFLKDLENLDVKNVLVVGHGYVLRSVVGYILYGNAYDSHSFVNLKDKFLTVNTGVSVCEYSKDDGWSLLTWNDHAHLAE